MREKHLLSPRLLWPLAGLCLLLLALRGPAQSAAPSLTSPSGASTTDHAPVSVNGLTLFDVAGADNMTAAERADSINRRLQALIARSQPIPPFTQRDVIPHETETEITLGGDHILSVTDADAADALSTREQLALLWGGKMAIAVAEARAARANPLRGAGLLIRNSFRNLLVSAVQWLPRLVGALFLWLLFWLLARLARWMIKIGTRHLHMDVNLRQLLHAMAFYGVWAVGIVAILATLGLNSASIAAGLGISGFVLGFAFKDILSHFFAGLMLLLTRQFHIGDQIVVNNFEGTVERIELRALYLRTYDNRLVMIPNGDVFTAAVTSNTASPYRRREFVVSIDYSDDIEKAQHVALQTMKETEGVLEQPPPDVLVDELTSSMINLRLRFHANSLRADYLKVGSDCMRRVKQAFEREGISLPNSTQAISIENISQIVDRMEQILSEARGNGLASSPKHYSTEDLSTKRDIKPR